jgi:rhodanese-related sulfurtransferase
MYLDVRSKREYAAGHVPGAVHVPYWRVVLRGIGRIAPPGEELIVYCELGPRAWIAKAALKLRGRTGVRLLTGHMSAWRRVGKPLE